MVSTIIHFSTHSLMCNYITTVDNKYKLYENAIAYISIAILFQLQLRGLPACREWVVS